MSVKATDLWQVGTRIFFGDEFVQMVDLEGEAADFFGGFLPTLIDSDQFLKRINHFYTQKRGAFENFAHELSRSAEYTNVTLQERPSPLGLPLTLSYHHIETGIDVSFDGLVFVSEKLLLPGEFTLDELLDEAARRRSIFEDLAEYQYKNWPRFFYKIQAHTDWRYVTGDCDLSDILKTSQSRLQKRLNEVACAVDLIDPMYMQTVTPTGDTKVGRRYRLLLGNRNLVREILAHDQESSRFLFHLNQRLGGRTRSMIERVEHVSKGTEVVPPDLVSLWRFNRWTRTAKYWTELHRLLEDALRFQLRLPDYETILRVFERWEMNGVAFHNLPNPIISVNGKRQASVAAYWTWQPVPLIKKDDQWHIGDYNPQTCGFAGSPAEGLKLLAWSKAQLQNFLELAKTLSGSVAVQASMVVSTLTLLALIVGLIAVIVSLATLAVSFGTPEPPPQQEEQTHTSVQSADDERRIGDSQAVSLPPPATIILTATAATPSFWEFWTNAINLASRQSWNLALEKRVAVIAVAVLIFLVSTAIIYKVRGHEAARDHLRNALIAAVATLAVAIFLFLCNLFFVVPFTMYQNAARERAASQQDAKNFEDELQKRDNELKRQRETSRNLLQVAEAFAVYRTAIGRTTPCEIRVTAPTQSQELAITVAQLVTFVTQCKPSSAYSSDSDPDTEEQIVKGSVPDGIVFHARKEAKGAYVLFRNLSNYVRLVRSYDVPAQAPDNFIWLQFGSDTKWISEHE